MNYIEQNKVQDKKLFFYKLQSSDSAALVVLRIKWIRIKH